MHAIKLRNACQTRRKISCIGLIRFVEQNSQLTFSPSMIGSVVINQGSSQKPELTQAVWEFDIFPVSYTTAYYLTLEVRKAPFCAHEFDTE